ncbi:MAG: phosphoenolpyruvate--protein phosphotransferase [Desulfosalsimonadaceae bacterium]
MQRDQIHLLQDIFQIIAESEGPEVSLERIGQMLIDRCGIDVCSVYVYHPEEEKLVLRATVGLNKEVVGSISMDRNEGLTGLVLETMEPVFVVNPAEHSRFKYYEDSGEEIYQTFLGLPLIYHQQAIGVLVIQTISADSITEDDLPIFENITSQIAATVAYTGILKSFSGRSGQSQSAGTSSSASSRFQRNYLRGESVSFGVAEGYAHYLPENISFSQVHCTLTEDSEADLSRIERAFEKAGAQIQHIAEQAKALSTEESGIIEAHLMFLRDKSLKQKIRSKIESGNCAEYALKETVYEYVDMFRSIENPYLNDRSADILDIGQRVLENLIGGGNGENPAFSRDTIVIASDLSPVDLLAIRQTNLQGVVLVNGGRTSHTVILAKSFEIPIVIGVDGVLDTVRENDYLILDGSSGFVFANPPDEIQVEYERRRKEREQAIEDMAATLGFAATTKDDFTVQVGANIGLLSDTELVAKYRADFVGLYRTEFPFMLRKSFPTEEEQVALYRKILENTAPLTVTIRTFDAGGDKMFSYYEVPAEDNPFLGWRSIRISLDMEDIFRTQIRAILRASAFGNTNILFPMISCITEVHRIRSIVMEEKENLRQQNISFDPDIQMGIMVEVPGVVPILERVLSYVDFVSIGTNDLIQYLLAVDRNNKRVASRYNLLHPSVVSTIANIVSTCRQADKPVSICGESAANPRGIFLFVGMGADRLSMTPSAIAAAKSFIRSIRRSDARKCLEEALEKEDAGAISRLLQLYLDHSGQFERTFSSMHLTDA